MGWPETLRHALSITVLAMSLVFYAAARTGGSQAPRYVDARSDRYTESHANPGVDAR